MGVGDYVPEGVDLCYACVGRVCHGGCERAECLTVTANNCCLGREIYNL